MMGGEALQWKEQWLDSITGTNGDLTFPNHGNSIKKIVEAFTPVDVTRDAVHQIKILKQGNKTAKQLVTEFKLLIGQAGLSDNTKSDHIHLIKAFQKSLNPPLARWILFGENVPNTIQGWYEKAIQYNNNFREGQETMKIEGVKRQWIPRTIEKDPNAMDIGNVNIGQTLSRLTL